MMERVVEHGADVVRALRARLPPALVAAVRRHLVVRRRTPLKEWAYYRLRAIYGDDHEEPTRFMTEYTRTLPPHHWSPCMDLPQQWDAIMQILQLCEKKAS